MKWHKISHFIPDIVVEFLGKYLGGVIWPKYYLNGDNKVQKVDCSVILS